MMSEWRTEERENKYLFKSKKFPSKCNIKHSEAEEEEKSISVFFCLINWISFSFYSNFLMPPHLEMDKIITKRYVKRE